MSCLRQPDLTSRPRRHERLCAGLAAADFDLPAETHFALADVRPPGDDGVAFCRLLPDCVGVGPIPGSAFCPSHAAPRQGRA